MCNPFFYGNPVASDQFLDRRREVRRVVSRIINRGQSTAVVGEPRSGKTSLLLYVSARETRDELYGEAAKRLLFAYLDAQTLDGQFNQAEFWRFALRPVREQLIVLGTEHDLLQAYASCEENAFGACEVEQLLGQTRQAGWQLILMLDEFEVLLGHPLLRCAEFFGGLRSLASRSEGALALIAATRCSLQKLNEETQNLCHAGSPYFNFLDELVLGPWPEGAIDDLLHRAGDRFAPQDRRFIKGMAGGHPYLLQVVASALWEAYEDGISSASERRQQAEQRLCAEAARTLSDCWTLWPAEAQKAMAAVALAQINTWARHEKIVGKRDLHVDRLTQDIPDLRPELQALANQGFVVEDDTVLGGWRVRPLAFLHWLSSEMVQATRSPKSFEGWVQAQAIEGVLTQEEKEQLGKAARTLGDFVKDFLGAFSGAAAKAAGERIGKGT